MQQFEITTDNKEVLNSADFDFIMISTKSRSFDIGRHEFTSPNDKTKKIVEKSGRINSISISDWIEITGEEDFPKHYDTILLSCLNEDKEQFFNLGHYDHEKKKYILDFGTEEINQNIEITHYKELDVPL